MEEELFHGGRVWRSPGIWFSTPGQDLHQCRNGGAGAQRRCACPIHRGDGRGRTFSVSLEEDVFQCFAKECGAKGDVIDLWAAVRQLSLREAALDLVRTFDLEPVPRPGTEKRNG